MRPNVIESVTIKSDVFELVQQRSLGHSESVAPGNRRKLDVASLRGMLPGDRWERVQGLTEALPPGINVPSNKLYHVTVSGSLDAPRTEVKHGVQGDIVGAWDVFRHDPQDAPFVFNKDHYFVLRSAGADDPEYWLHGPFRKGEPDHWLKEIPDEFADCELLVSRGSNEEE